MDENLYSRQLAVLGHAAMAKMQVRYAAPLSIHIGPTPAGRSGFPPPPPSPAKENAKNG